ncbi:MULTISPECIES: FtsX-like permease family protein [Vagococcus]|uniref:FtsX-like permease family protein n=1 Tax=Vagococcus TaxID=2737 RepID=UPI002FCAAA42
MTKSYYLIQDSFRQLIRTKGIFLTFILSSLVSIIGFFCYFLFLFFNHIHLGMVADLEKETDFIAVQMGMAPVMAMLVFKIGALILSLLIFLLLILYIKKSFKQFLFSQQEQVKIRHLLGESTRYLNGLSIIQMELFLFLTLFIGCGLSNQIFKYSVIETLKIGVDSENINSFQIDFISLATVFIVLLCFLFLSSYHSLNKSYERILIE